MEIFKTQKLCLLYLFVVLSFSICPVHSLSPAGTTETTTNQQEVPASLPQSEGKKSPLLSSPPTDTPIDKIPFAKSVGNHGQQSQLGNQQQEEPNDPEQSINQPLSGFNQPFSTVNQPVPGLNQPFSTINQPFGANNQRGSLQNAAFINGVSKKNTGIQGVILVFLLVCFGFLV